MHSFFSSEASAFNVALCSFCQESDTGDRQWSAALVYVLTERCPAAVKQKERKKRYGRFYSLAIRLELFMAQCARCDTHNISGLYLQSMIVASIVLPGCHIYMMNVCVAAQVCRHNVWRHIRQKVSDVEQLEAASASWAPGMDALND